MLSTMTAPVTGNLQPNVFDTRALGDIKRLAKDGDPQALKAAARQFEALFLQMVLKSMRDATPRDGLFDSDQTRMYESLLDQQLAQVMSGKGGTGLAAMIEKQLSRPSADPALLEGALPNPAATLPASIERAVRPAALPAIQTPNGLPVSPNSGEVSSDARDFINRIWPDAVEVSRTTGIPATFLIAQAALETGWGKAEPRSADGRRSFNLFGIKAGKGWSGATVDAATTEVVDGVVQKQVERFRAYGSYAEAFQDYSRLLAGNPRYAAVLGSRDGESFARGLQQAGYATDPAYADKLRRILSGTTLRQALTG